MIIACSPHVIHTIIACQLHHIQAILACQPCYIHTIITCIPMTSRHSLCTSHMMSLRSFCVGLWCPYDWRVQVAWHSSIHCVTAPWGPHNHHVPLLDILTIAVCWLCDIHGIIACQPHDIHAIVGCWLHDIHAILTCNPVISTQSWGVGHVTFTWSSGVAAWCSCECSVLPCGIHEKFTCWPCDIQIIIKCLLCDVHVIVMCHQVTPTQSSHSGHVHQHDRCMWPCDIQRRVPVIGTWPDTEIYAVFKEGKEQDGGFQERTGNYKNVDNNCEKRTP